MVADGKPLWFKIITTNLHFLNFSLRTNCKKKKFREKRRKIILNLCSVNKPNRFTGLLKKTRCFRYCFIRFCLSNYFYFFLLLNFVNAKSAHGPQDILSVKK